MARLFGALANAGAQVNTNRFKRQQYDDQQAAQAREEARRVFEFAALQKDRQEQAKAAAQEREQARLFQAQEAGYADAPDVAGVRAGGAAMAAMGGFHTNAEQAVAQEDAPFQREVEGVQYQAPKVASQYLTIGGKTLRKNRQSEANAAKDAEAQKFMAQVVMNRDIKSQLQMQRDIAAGERAGAANQTREIVAGIAAASRPQPQEKRDLWTDGKGGYLRLGMDDPIPAGFQPVRSGGTGATQTKGQNEARAQRTALEDISSQYYALNEGGGIPEISMGAAGAIAVINDPNAGAAAQTAARTALARLASPATQKAANFVNQIAGVMMPLRGGRAITKNEVSIILGGMTAVAGESPEMRRQRMGAFLKIVGPVLAAEDGDLDGAIARIQQRAQQYAPQGRGQASKPGTMSFDAALQRVKP